MRLRHLCANGCLILSLLHSKTSFARVEAVKAVEAGISWDFSFFKPIPLLLLTATLTHCYQSALVFHICSVFVNFQIQNGVLHTLLAAGYLRPKTGFESKRKIHKRSKAKAR